MTYSTPSSNQVLLLPQDAPRSRNLPPPLRVRRVVREVVLRTSWDTPLPILPLQVRHGLRLTKSCPVWAQCPKKASSRHLNTVAKPLRQTRLRLERPCVILSNNPHSLNLSWTVQLHHLPPSSRPRDKECHHNTSLVCNSFLMIIRNTILIIISRLFPVNLSPNINRLRLDFNP